ncbi:Gfo/Idh/MocA family protein [Haloarchaeobius sp. DFWS5]|uniref:Gfo/Idh/MocA family protein n=1 Tax=Haloarchaeobius sp. DFWS5 TaxID=3446114 RepID=UPI003EBFBCB7
MRIAFIGAGKMAGGLMDCVDDVDSHEIVAVCDVNEQAARDAADPRGASVYTDHHTLFEAEEFDIVFVAIPPFAYDDQAELAAEHGVHCFVEKPVGLHPEDAREWERVLDDAGVVTGSGYVFRYDAITERAIELIDQRQIALLDACYWSSLLASEWGNEMELSGGDINVRATHVYDLLRYLGGEVDRVFAAGSESVGTPEIDYFDAVAATLEHETGVVSNVSSSVTAPEWTVELDIVGDDFEMHLDYPDQRLTGLVDGEAIEFDGTCDRYAKEVEQFLQACEADDQSLVRCSFADATRTLELNWAAIDAAASRSVSSPGDR